MTYLAAPRSQVKQQPNPRPKADNKTVHISLPPRNCIKSYNLINLYILLPNQRSRFWGFWGLQELEIVQ